MCSMQDEPRGCPEGWVPATQPLNPMLVCLPDTITYNPPRPGGR